ncbi:MAG: DegT/DnrJ/EryC1/StrS family aminotransferase [Firmicutes bacterium]|nr:DegT/DnrJ/EryC1/StrS family aminotransferase [Bacillota bacterium]
MKKVSEKIPITKPFLGEEEVAAFAKAIKSGWVSQGPMVQKFEEAFCTLSGVEFAVASTSCTTALHLALIAAGVKSGDEVIVPAFTFIASANVVEYTGAKPVFVDIDISTFNIDASKIEEKITKNTRAIMPVHLFGLCADMDPVMEIAEKHRLAVIEDAACAAGSLYNGKWAGTFGDAGAFSFHPRKIITTGEGGMITTNDKGIAEKCRELRSHGGKASDLERHNKGDFALPEHDELGYNYRMTDIQAAMGLEQLKKLDYIITKRRNIAAIYDEHFYGINELAFPAAGKKYFHTYQSYVLRIIEKSPIDRDSLALKLQESGISTRQGTHSVPHLGYYRKKYGYTEKDFPLSFKADKTSLTIPLFPSMSEESLLFVIKEIRNNLK